MQQGTPEQHNDEIASGIERMPVDLEQQQQRAQESPQRIGEGARRAKRMRLHSEQQQQEEANVSGVQRQPPAVPRVKLQDLNVEQALNYVDSVRMTYIDRPHMYDQFISILNKYKYGVLDTAGVLARIRHLFNGNPRLINGFNQFLPPDYKPSM